MEPIVPRLVCERFPRYVIVRRHDSKRVMYWAGERWTRSLRAARLYDRIEQVNEIILRFQSPLFWN